MANRNMQQKLLKSKRANRYARFSGATSKFLPVPASADGDEKVLVGPVSLSKQVINTGRGPDPERMAEYYNRIRNFVDKTPKTRSFKGFDTTKPGDAQASSYRNAWLRSFGDTNEGGTNLLLRYQEIVRDTPKEMRINLVNNHTGMLDLYFSGTQFFFVEIDYKKKMIRRSKTYGSKKFAMRMLELRSITWVETIVSPRGGRDPPK